jgi:hypothetical protein
MCAQGSLGVTENGGSHMWNRFYVMQEGLSSVDAVALTYFNVVFLKLVTVQAVGEIVI